MCAEGAVSNGLLGREKAKEITFKIEREGCGWEFTLRNTVFLIDSYLIKGTSGGMRDGGVFSNVLENSSCLDIFSPKSIL